MSDPQQPGDQPPNGGQPQYGGQPAYGGQDPYGAQTPGSQPAYGAAPGSGQYGGYPSPESSTGQQETGFFGALFDFSFSTFVTPKIVKFVYVLATIALALGLLFFIVSAFSQSAGIGVAVLIVGPVLFLVYLAFIRMTLEFYFALVRMSEDIHKRLPPG